MLDPLYLYLHRSTLAQLYRATVLSSLTSSSECNTPPEPNIECTALGALESVSLRRSTRDNVFIKSTVVGERAVIFQLLSGIDEPLLLRWDPEWTVHSSFDVVKCVN
ncbi:hypothetical protein PMIN06_005625 [Paraphaeosphaeria minitans]